MAEEKTLTIKKDIIWKVATVLFAVLFVVSLFTGGFGIGGHAVANGETGEYATLQERICASIRGTPAWADSEGNVIDYGYKETNSVDDLIEAKMYFIYHPGCGWCQKQITFFGEEWQKYIDSGYTIDCSAV